jgi:hypothetical protein
MNCSLNRGFNGEAGALFKQTHLDFAEGSIGHWLLRIVHWLATTHPMKAVFLRVNRQSSIANDQLACLYTAFSERVFSVESLKHPMNMVGKCCASLRPVGTV